MQSTQQVKKGYNRLAGVYDLLKCVVFGDVLDKAELKSVEWLKNCDTVLMLGGGTGLFLEALVRLNIKQIIYVELSDGMMAKAKQRVSEIKYKESEIIFIQKSWEEYTPEIKVDSIVCNFFFDMFPEEVIQKIIGHYAESSHPGTLWYVTDFSLKSDSTRLHRGLVNMMYVFFVAFCKIEAKQLPSIFTCFERCGFDEKVRLQSAYLRQCIFQKK